MYERRPTFFRTEDAPTGPLSVYGRTKLDGEMQIRASGCRHLILRTSWVYAARGGNFAKTMLKLAKERDKLTVIDDQIGSPRFRAMIELAWHADPPPALPAVSPELED